MRSLAVSLAASLLANVANASPTKKATAPFLTSIGNQTWVIGNDVWNMTQGPQFGVKLYYKDHDCVGDAWGHYVSYNGAADNLVWTSASIVKNGKYKGVPFIDIQFTSDVGDMHWVIFEGQHGAYQYFVNHNLPTLGEFRTLWRLDNTTFPKGRTVDKDGTLPPLSDYIAANKVQDETWLAPDGKGYITKYDWASWDYYNGNQLKQELMVHRESSTGDAVQLNMVHGTHFMVSSADVFPDGKMWGPWLWYLNDGSKPDAAARAKEEFAAWPYAWLDDEAYHARGKVSGRLVLSDGRPAAGAAVFLGDDEPTKTALDMGSTYYYTTYADERGNFEFADVRAATYGLQAWSHGGEIADVSTSLLHNGVAVATGKTTRLGTLAWAVSNRTRLFQVGDFDRYSYGFLYGGAPRQHALVASCPADLVYRVGTSKTADWCFGQTYQGNWTIEFEVAEDPAAAPARQPNLIVSLAGYSSGASSTVWANGHVIGNMTSGSPELQNDPCLYRSATAAGEWRLLEFQFDQSVLQKGLNTVTFQMTRNTTWHGFMWDSIILEW
ncbi:91248076-cdc2-4831-98e6-2ed04e510963 [Thermothielavioides terrestris]|uniref:rhamnogalacturonan endolyase n=1 Tax=Thermothielavioides terrestris TaxID=2587410 RepID=A0A3S4D0M0_9PEZI|nr:91248076-cdc2-4831-98e6-2ed04e510963 [Thermothielavioides terrestris]